MPVYVIDTLKPKNGLDFPVVEAVDIAVEGYVSLADAVTHFATNTAIAAINAALDTKADKTTTDSLQAQIDQIVISASAESVVAPEVAAARVGADGTSYSTLKERLDEEQEKQSATSESLRESLENLIDNAFYYESLEILDFSDDCYISYDSELEYYRIAGARSDVLKCVYAECKPNRKYTITKSISNAFSVGTTNAKPVIGSRVYNVISNNNAQELTITTDAATKYIVVYYCYNDENPESIRNSINIRDVESYLAVDQICRDIILSDNTTDLSLENATIRSKYGINNKNKWTYQSQSPIASLLYYVGKGDEITLKANENYYTIYAFIKDYNPIEQGSVDFFEDDKSRHIIQAGDTQTISCKNNGYLYVYYQTNAGDLYFPESASVKETRFTSLERGGKGETQIDISRFAVNYCDENTIVYETQLLNTGEVEFNSNFNTTDYIKIYLGSKWYQQVRYVHCCSSGSGLPYGFRAKAIAFYDIDYNFISYAENINAPVAIPENSHYIKVCFTSSSKNLFISTDNRSILQPYHKYNEKLLVESDTNYVSEITNSDGAITRMIATGLDYLYDTDLGYGDIATAFDDIVEAVPSEFSPPKYDGEKMQIDCSAFVELCLQGIMYQNSRYIDPSGINYTSLYNFDTMTEFNFHNKNVNYNHIWGADHKKMYANKLFKYAYDRGLHYNILSDFSNIEVGDVIFLSNTYDDFFMNIGHCVIVSAARLNNDGSKSIDIMESTSNGIGENKNYSYSSNMIYAARFPLPALPINAKNLITDFEEIDENISAESGETIFLNEFTSAINITAKSIITIMIKCTIPDNSDFIVKISGEEVDPISSNTFRRKDGIIVKHWHYYKNSLINTNKIIVGIKANDTLSNTNVLITDIQMFEGYLSEKYFI